MRTDRLVVSLVASALLGLVAARPAEGQPITCPADQTVISEDNLKSLSVGPSLNLALLAPGAPVTCTPPTGSDFPLGTTTVTCSATAANGQPASCSFKVNVVPATPDSVTFTEAPLTNPFPGTSIFTGASWGQLDVYYQAAGQFLIYDNRVFTQAVPSQGFVAFNAAPTDVGVSFVGKRGTELLIADMVLGGAQPSIKFTKATDQAINTSGGIFLAGNHSGALCGGTPADGKLFHRNTSGNFFFHDLPTGSRMQDVVSHAGGCVALGAGNKNGMFFFSQNESSFVNLSFTPGAITPARDGNFHVTDAGALKIYRIRRDGIQVEEFNLTDFLFRISTLENGMVAGGRSSTRKFSAVNLELQWQADHVLAGSGNNITDFKYNPRQGLDVHLNDPTVGRDFVRELKIETTVGRRHIKRRHPPPNRSSIRTELPS